MLFARCLGEIKVALIFCRDTVDLLKRATPQELLQLIQHHIEVLELAPIDPKTHWQLRHTGYSRTYGPDGASISRDNGGPDDSTPV